jgi:DNA-binding MarR family transcriptional regulator
MRRVPPDRLATGFDSPDESPGFLLWQVTNRWQQAQRAALKPLGLTHVQFVLLATLSWHQADGPVTQRRLADAAATDPMMTSQVLRTLESAGLIERGEHPADKRANALVATAAGRALADRAVTVVEACDREFFAPLGVGVADFGRALAQLRPHA